MPRDPVVIYSAASIQQAYLLKNLLEEQGIAARVVNDAIQMAGGELPLGWSSAARVVVPEHDAIQAREIAERFDAQTAHHAPDHEDAGNEAESHWQDWPACPQCGEPRLAKCPICGTSGSDFPEADMPDQANVSQPLLICQSCDDTFAPQWYRLCPRCGHDFGDGVMVESHSQPLDSSSRLWTLVALLFAGAIALFAYFLWLFGWRPG